MLGIDPFVKEIKTALEINDDFFLLQDFLADTSVVLIGLNSLIDLLNCLGGEHAWRTKKTPLTRIERSYTYFFSTYRL
jgi:hypothetical protein